MNRKAGDDDSLSREDKQADYSSNSIRCGMGYFIFLLLEPFSYNSLEYIVNVPYRTTIGSCDLSCYLLGPISAVWTLEVSTVPAGLA